MYCIHGTFEFMVFQTLLRIAHTNMFRIKLENVDSLETEEECEKKNEISNLS